MKSIFLSLAIILPILLVKGQSNIFPDSGSVGIGTTNPSADLEIVGSIKYTTLLSGERDISVEGPQRSNHRGNGTQTATGLAYRVLSNPPAGDPIFQVQSSGYAVRLFAEHDGYTGAKQNSAWFGGTKFDNYFKGNVGIGTLDTGTWKLAVNGKIRAKEIKVEADWADYVFHTDYDLPTLKEVERHIREKGHLINIPSAEEVAKNGIRLGEMNRLLLEKIEELTLYMIQQNTMLENQKETNRKLEKRLSKLEDHNKNK